jgi:hypothetical protein
LNGNRPCSNLKLRSSLSTSQQNVNNKNNNNNNNRRSASTDSKKEKTKKTLSFSDDEILLDSNCTRVPAKYATCNDKSKIKPSRDRSFDTSSRNADSNSTTRNTTGTQTQQTQQRQSRSGCNYDYKMIYDAFEKPIHQMTHNNDLFKKVHHNKERNYIDPESIKAASEAVTAAVNNKQSNSHQIPPFQTSVEALQAAATLSLSSSSSTTSTASTASSSAASSSSSSSSCDPLTITPPLPLPSQSQSNSPIKINNFYSLTKETVSSLPKNEMEMLMRQLRRNFVLLNHSHQRFSLLSKLYEPYELIYHHRCQNSNENKVSSSINENNQKEKFSIDDLTSFLHNSFQTIQERIKRIENKMEIVENNLKLEVTNNKSERESTQSAMDNNNNSNMFRLFEYQIIEMQHEYELLVEDKLIIEQLMDNQMKIFTKFKNLSNEKPLIEQYGALKQEIDTLKVQQNKINKLINDTIAEKCKQQLLISHNHTQNNPITIQNRQDNEKQSLFRATFVPVTAVMTSLAQVDNIDAMKSTPSIWKMNSPQINLKQQNNDQIIKKESSNIIKPTTTPSSYQQHHHFHYLNNKNNNNNNNNISKSIESLYNPSNDKKKALVDDYKDYKELNSIFKPINSSINSNSNTRSRQVPIHIQKSLANGKNPKADYFQPIPIKHEKQQQQSARERLFGNSNYYSPQQQAHNSEDNNRKIALVKPELRESSDE